MVAGGLLGHTMAKANEKSDESKTINNYYGQPQTEQDDPIVEANKASLKTSTRSTPTKQTSKTDKAY
tara:strand:+ start:761 stop:961 length:201 start_codon:yes stop_codon:yes gene_type:complete